MLKKYKNSFLTLLPFQRWPTISCWLHWSTTSLLSFCQMWRSEKKLNEWFSNVPLKIKKLNILRKKKFITFTSRVDHLLGHELVRNRFSFEHFENEGSISIHKMIKRSDSDFFDDLRITDDKTRISKRLNSVIFYISNGKILLFGQIGDRNLSLDLKSKWPSNQL